MQQFGGSHWTDFRDVGHLTIFFRKSVEEIHVSIKPDENKWHLKTDTQLLSYRAHYFLE